MLLRRIARHNVPDSRSDDTDEGTEPECGVPAGEQDDGGEQRRSDARSKADTAKNNATCLAAFVDGEPTFDKLVCGGIHDGAAGAECDPDEEEDPDGAGHPRRDKAGKNGEDSPQGDKRGEHAARAEALDKDAAGDLEGCIADKKKR